MICLPMKIIWAVLGLLGSAVGLFLLWVLLMGILALFIDPRKNYMQNSKLHRSLVKPVLYALNFLAGARIKANGIEKVPTDTRFLLICNHRSDFDPLVTWQLLWNYDLSFVCKPPVFRIPIFGRIIRKFCFLPINREDPREAMRSINHAASLIQNGEVSIAVYPEGTRSKECRLLGFHCGVLKIAQKAKVPVVVATVQGTEKICRNFPWRPSEIEFDVLEVIPADRVGAERSTALGEYARRLMAEKLGDDIASE